MEKPFGERKPDSVGKRIDKSIDLQKDVKELHHVVGNGFKNINQVIKSMATKEDISAIKEEIAELKAIQAVHQEILLSHGELLRMQGKKLDQLAEQNEATNKKLDLIFQLLQQKSGG